MMPPLAIFVTLGALSFPKRWLCKIYVFSQEFLILLLSFRFSCLFKIYDSVSIRLLASETFVPRLVFLRMFPVRALNYHLFSCFKVCVLVFQASDLLQYRKCPEPCGYGVGLHIPCQNEVTNSSHWGALVVKNPPANAGEEMWV